MRPYQALRVTDLERVFEASKGDRDILDALKAELGHRSTPSAERLRGKVQKAIADLTRASDARAERDPDEGEVRIFAVANED